MPLESTSPALFDTYSNDYKLARMTDGRPVLIPSNSSEQINKTYSITHRDTQIITYLSTRVNSIFEVRCDGGHLLALSQYYGMNSFGIDIDKRVVKECVRNGINCAYGDMTILTDTSLARNHYLNQIHEQAIKNQLIAFLNFTHVPWEGNKHIYKHQLFNYASSNFRYILCSLYDNEVEKLEKQYPISLIHSFSNWKNQFNRPDNLNIQYNNKLTTCCLETYLNLQKLFIVN